MTPPPNQPSRIARFTRSLVSGYAVVGLNILYGLISVPLGLHYLSKTEYGLWMLVAQLMVYMTLIDLGMNGATVRTLIDHKDDRESDLYGSTLVTGALVNCVQGAFIILVGALSSLFVVHLFNVEPALLRPFVILILGQSLVIGFRYATRSFWLALQAHQRFDVTGVVEAVQVIFLIAGLWVSFVLGAGIYSILWANAIANAVGLVLGILACRHFRVLPEKGRWGRPSWPLFLELCTFGKDAFLLVVGNQFLGASQVILVTRVIGLEAAAIWSVCARAYNLILQFTSKLRDYSEPALSEILVRKEHARFLSRFRSLISISTSIAAFSAVMFALGNQPFVDVLTRGVIHWPAYNDVLLGALIILLLPTRNYTTLSVHTKNFSSVRYIFFIEGVFFIAVALVVLPYGGMTAMIAASIVGSLLFSFPTSLRKVARYFDLPVSTVLIEWSKPMLAMMVWLVPIALANYWLFHGLSSVWKLVAYTVGAGIPGIALFLLYGVDADIKAAFVPRIPARFARLLGPLLAHGVKFSPTPR